jgi:hypothetical protein
MKHVLITFILLFFNTVLNGPSPMSIPLTTLITGRFGQAVVAVSSLTCALIHVTS